MQSLGMDNSRVAFTRFLASYSDNPSGLRDGQNMGKKFLRAKLDMRILQRLALNCSSCLVLLTNITSPITFHLHLNKKTSMAIYGSCVGQTKYRQNVLKADSAAFILDLALLYQVKLGLQLRSTLNEGKNREKTKDTFHVWGIVPDAGFPPFSAVSSVQKREVLH